MLRQRSRTLQAAMAVADALATIAAFFSAYYGAGVLLQELPQEWIVFRTVLPVSRYLWVLAVSVPMWWILFGLFRCYDFSPLERLTDSLRRTALPMVTGALTIGAIVFFAKELLFARRVVGGFLVANVILIIIGRALVLAAAARSHKAAGRMRRILVVGAGEAARKFGATVERAGWGLHLAGYITSGQADQEPSQEDRLGAVDDLAGILDEGAIDDVVLADPVSDLGTVQQVIRACEEVGVCIHFAPQFFNAKLSRPHVETFSGIPMLTFTATPYNPVALGVKRAMDLVLGLLLLLLAAIPMLAVAVIIKLTSRGPVIFKQRRSGLYGREFTMYKFRSMTVDAEQRRAELDSRNEMDGPVFKLRDDPRITPFGRRLRRYSLDELPQLWNVLKGDMSLIGPRPPLPAEVRNYQRWQRRRLSMRPGLTCIWQVTDRNLATFDKWMEYDLQYIDNWSLRLDLKIALLTIPAVFKGTGV